MIFSSTGWKKEYSIVVIKRIVSEIFEFIFTSQILCHTNILNSVKHNELSNRNTNRKSCIQKKNSPPDFILKFWQWHSISFHYIIRKEQGHGHLQNIISSQLWFYQIYRSPSQKKRYRIHLFIYLLFHFGYLPFLLASNINLRKIKNFCTKHIVC